MTPTVVVTLRCTDQRGIVKAVADTVFEVRGNIVDSAQFWDQPSDSFSLRMEIQVDENSIDALEASLNSNLAGFLPEISVRPIARLRRALLLVTTADHCLRELLYHAQAGELSADIAGIVSNHEVLRPIAEQFGVPFFHVPVSASTKSDAEARLDAIVTETNADFLVLARYMQVLTDEFCARYPGRIINIHHSFLPGFKGAKPYHQAYDRGVKLIGATAHYVTADLDEGPIIEQDVVRVGHHHSAEQLVSIGRDVERRVLARAVRLHAEDRVFPSGTRTVVFDS
jgi:formyltetrahydrofolate deformylase